MVRTGTDRFNTTIAIVATSDQIIDDVAQKSIRNRITEVANPVPTIIWSFMVIYLLIALTVVSVFVSSFMICKTNFIAKRIDKEDK